jgi:hypothetical protein
MATTFKVGGRGPIGRHPGLRIPTEPAAAVIVATDVRVTAEADVRVTSDGDTRVVT